MFRTNGTLFFIKSYKIIFFLMKIKHNNGYMEKLCNKWKPLGMKKHADDADWTDFRRYVPVRMTLFFV
jgi:hypothetical protein